jgi:DNA invertase Pin-like site-specific DNA recombinase
MSLHHSIRAACLYRCSDEKQENSVDRQRDGVAPYAKRKSYQIVSEYVFEGIPGDEINKHPKWQQLLRDVAAGKWKVLLVDEPSRLSREHPDYFVRDVKIPLKEAGIKVDTVSRGVMDWDTIAGDILTLVDSHRSRDEVQYLSRRTLGEMARLAKLGLLHGGIVPYGLRVAKTIDSSTGEVLDRKFVFGPEEEVRVVRFIFDAMANRGWSLRRICRELENRGVKPPPGNGRGKSKETGKWHRGTVRVILKNRKYVGDFPWNQKHYGKYSSWKGGAGGRVEQNGAINRRVSKNAEEDWIIVPDLIPPIIDRDTFVRANVAMSEAQKRTSPNQDRVNYLFTRMIVCGDCGAYMHGCVIKGGKEKGYSCRTYKEHGAEACWRNQVNERAILKAILDKTLNVILDPKRLDAIEAEIERRLARERQDGGAERIRKQIAALEKDIVQGNANLARLPEDRLPGVIACIRTWEKEKEDLEVKLKEIASGDTQEKAILAEARKQLWRLREGLEGDDEELQAAIVREVVSKVEVKFTHSRSDGSKGTTGKGRTYSRTEKAVIYVRPGLGLSCLVHFGEAR